MARFESPEQTSNATDADAITHSVSRRGLLGGAARLLLGLAVAPVTGKVMAGGRSNEVTLFLCGDVMTGRGVDQILPHPGDPRLYESYVRSAAGYVELAERLNGPINKPVAFAWPWGDALGELERRRPDLRIINLETSVTRSDEALPKGINYRMSPDNFPCITAAGIDCCVLANNHVLDWGEAGLRETLDTIEHAGIAVAGAGRNREEAAGPAVLDLPEGGRVLVFAFGCEDSGVPYQWAAGAKRPGVNVLGDLSRGSARKVAAQVQAARRPDDLVVVSLHWGGNWGYAIPAEHRRFAHALIDAQGVDIVYGHSSHHPRPLEVYKGRLILYSCGDFLNDYEGIQGYESYRDDLVLMYLPVLRAGDSTLARLTMVPFRIRNMSLHRASHEDAAWLAGVLDRESQRFDARVSLESENTLSLEWD
jgi:poly-gamma-glutamate capsule biosynthesis protein CapA/YwtB (metallophosphatase superfamily)